MKPIKLDTVLTFGKHKGKTVKDVIDSGPDGYNYIAWANQNIDHFKFDRSSFDYCREKGLEYARKMKSLKVNKVDKYGFNIMRATAYPTGEYAQDAYENGGYDCDIHDDGLWDE